MRLPGWRNGRRAGLKIPWPQGRAGSSPAPGIRRNNGSRLRRALRRRGCHSAHVESVRNRTMRRARRSRFAQLHALFAALSRSHSSPGISCFVQAQFFPIGAVAPILAALLRILQPLTRERGQGAGAEAGDARGARDFLVHRDDVARARSARVRGAGRHALDLSHLRFGQFLHAIVALSSGVASAVRRAALRAHEQAAMETGRLMDARIMAFGATRRCSGLSVRRPARQAGGFGRP
jgi:hypothetical protein